MGRPHRRPILVYAANYYFAFGSCFG
jgi:hypothetical protein